MSSIKSFLGNFAKIAAILAVALLAPAISIQAYGLPFPTQYALGIAVSIFLYLLLVKIKFDLKIAMLGALTAFLGSLYTTTLLIRGTVLETLKVFVKGEKLSIFIEGVLKHIVMPTEFSYYTLTIIALWTALIAALLILSTSIIHYFSASWFFLENLIPPLSKPLNKYLPSLERVNKISGLTGLVIAISIFSIDIVLNPEIPSLVFLFTNVSLNISTIIFGIVQLVLTRTISEDSHFSLMIGSQIGLVFFLILLNLIFWKRGIIKRFVPLKERLRIFSIIALGISVTYITLYLLIDVGTLTLLPYLLIAVLFNSILAARIESEFQVLFISSKLNTSTYRFLANLIGIEKLQGISALAPSILYLSVNPIIPAILVNIMSTASTYEKRVKQKGTNTMVYLPIILFMFLLFSSLFLPKYGGEIYEVESFIPETNTISLNTIQVALGAFISAILGVFHLLAFKYPLNPVAFIASQFINNYNSIGAIALATALKIACLKILKPKNYYSSLIIAIFTYLILNIVFTTFYQ